MAEVDISDLRATTKRFELLNSEMRCVLATRAALRVAANLSIYDGDAAETPVLAALRCTLTSAVYGLGRSGDVEWSMTAAGSAASAAVESANKLPRHDASSSSIAAAYSAAFTAAYSKTNSVKLSANSAASSVTLSDTNLATVWDIAHLDFNLNTKPLWAGAEVPLALQEAHDTFLTQLRTNPDWDFFRTWYEQMWEGTFTDWDLATAVAKIGDEVWEADLAEVAEAIRGIEARRRLEAEIATLRSELTELKASATPTVGHNQGPPLEDEDIAVRHHFELVWPVLEELEHEIEKDEPNPETLKRLAEAFWQVAKTIAVYCGGKIDVALEKAAETVGESGTKWAVRTVAATYVGSNQSVQSVAIAAWKYALTLLI